MKFDLTISPPLMNAAGTLGLAPGVEPAGLGAFITNPLSLGPRTPAHTRGMLAFPGGILIHSGHPNPGLKAVIRRCARRWSSLSIPVIVHLLAQSGDEIARMVRMVEEIEAVSAVEIGLPPEAGVELAVELVQAGVGEKPVIARLPLERATELAEAVMGVGAAAVSLGAPRGALPAEGGTLLHGRLYGPALFPQALSAVQALAGAGLPVIGACGVYRRSDVEAMLAAGALAVQLDTALWRGVESWRVEG
jgi:dihydroorotate dehydrogenase (NAD+) catalytic subunit